MKIRADKSRRAGIGFGALALALFAGQAAAQINIPGDAPDLLTAVSNANSGDTITISSGTYTGAGWTGVSTLGKNLTITGQGTVIIDLAAQGRAIAVNSGETVTINNITFTNGDAGFDDRGGTISVTGGSTVTVNECTFDNSVAFLEGGAVYVSNSTFTANDSVFQNNSVFDTGGAIFGEAATVSINGSTFQGNTAESGAGVAGLLSGTLSVSGSTFTQNTANLRASAIDTGNLDSLTISDTTIDNNIGAGFGGAVRATGATSTTLTDVVISNNNAPPGIVANGTMIVGGGAFNMTNVEFRNNSTSDTPGTGQAGGIQLEGPPTNPLVLDWNNVVFDGNSTGSLGGAMLMIGDISGTINGGSFVDNVCERSRAVAYGVDVAGPLTFQGVTFDNNDSFGFDPANPNGPTSSALNFQITGTATSDLQFVDCVWTNNTQTPTGTGTAFGGSVGMDLFDNASGSLTVTGSTFINNTSTQGSAIRTQGSTSTGALLLTTADNIYEGNNATFGTVIIFPTDSWIASGDRFIENTTASSGAAMYSFGGDIEADGVGFFGNTISGTAGRGTILADTSADNPGSLLLINSIFADNHTNTVAAGVVNLSSAMTLLNCTFHNNRNIATPGSTHQIDAAGGPGAQNRIINSIVWTDIADLAGQPDIRMDNAGDLTIENSLIRGGQANVFVVGSGTLTYAASNIDADPLFSDAAAGDFRLEENSPAVDAGSDSAYNAIASAITTDYLGGPRFEGAAINMGAVEETVTGTGPTCRPDLNGDGVVDADDFFFFLVLFSQGDPRADFTNDGVIDADDFFAFLVAFAQGC